MQLDPNTTDQSQKLQAAGRLKPEVTLQQANEEFKKAAAEYREKFPDALTPNVSFTVEPIQKALVGDVRETLLLLSGAVSFVLLIACANVANLLLMRATTRKREIAIRASLGAGQARIIRQLLTESVLLSLAGGALGILFGMGAIRTLLAVNTAGLPRIGDNGALVNVDWRVLGLPCLFRWGRAFYSGLFRRFMVRAPTSSQISGKAPGGWALVSAKAISARYSSFSKSRFP